MFLYLRKQGKNYDYVFQTFKGLNTTFATFLVFIDKGDKGDKEKER